MQIPKTKKLTCNATSDSNIFRLIMWQIVSCGKTKYINFHFNIKTDTGRIIIYSYCTNRWSQVITGVEFSCAAASQGTHQT